MMVERKMNPKLQLTNKAEQQTIVDMGGRPDADLFRVGAAGRETQIQVRDRSYSPFNSKAACSIRFIFFVVLLLMYVCINKNQQMMRLLLSLSSFL